MRSDATAGSGSMSAQELTAAFADQRAALLAGGRASAERRRALTELTDRWLAGLFTLAGGQALGASLIAVGGYGRGDLAPGSDIDLVLVHPAAASSARVNEVADALWYPIWDSGIKLDHSVRTPADLRRLAAADLRVVLGIIDARTVSGDEHLIRSARESVLGDWRAMAARRLPELHELGRERAERSGELAYVLEPNLKESRGGLRDLVALRAVAASWVTDAPLSGLVRHRDLLLDTRDVLHALTGRRTDVLVAQNREEVARELGLDGADAADDLSRAVSNAGRAIAYVSDDTWHRVDRLTRRSGSRFARTRRIAATRSDRTPLADGVVVHDAEVVLAADADPRSDPTLVLRLAAAAAQAGLRVAPHAVERLALAGTPLPTPWPAQARDALVSLLGAGAAALPVWEALDQLDLWSALLPEWAPVRSAPQHNPVHIYTVDRHLVEAAIQAVPHTRDVDRPDLLLIGALLHDIGKGRGGDHTQVGVRLMADIAPQLGFDAGDCHVLTEMVRLHLLLPEMATRRDLDDPATVAAVADEVGDERLLDLLHALTQADALATGPAAWSSWKKSLIDELVVRTRQELRARAGDVAEVGAVLPVTVPSEDLAADGVVVRVDHDERSCAVTVVAPDQNGLLSTVAGVLALHRLGVRGAQVETLASPSGEPRAVQVWNVLPMFGDPAPASRIREDISRVISGSLNLAERLSAREQDYGAPFGTAEPRVQVVPGASSRATVLEVRAHDAPGLLHRITSAIATVGVSITAARVTTLGSEVVDVFYLVGGSGRPLDSAQSNAVVGEVTEVLARGTR